MMRARTTAADPPALPAVLDLAEPKLDMLVLLVGVLLVGVAEVRLCDVGVIEVNVEDFVSLIVPLLLVVLLWMALVTTVCVVMDAVLCAIMYIII